MTRRTLVLLTVAAPAAIALPADPADEAWRLLVDAASALSQGDAVYFLSLCDSASPDYPSLRSNVTALLEAAEVQSSIDPVSNEGDDRRRTLEVDWLLRIRPRGLAGRAIERRRRVKCVLEKRGRKWRIVSLDPAFLALPQPDHKA